MRRPMSSLFPRTYFVHHPALWLPTLLRKYSCPLLLRAFLFIQKANIYPAIFALMINLIGTCHRDVFAVSTHLNIKWWTMCVTNSEGIWFDCINRREETALRDRKSSDRVCCRFVFELTYLPVGEGEPSTIILLSLSDQPPPFSCWTKHILDTWILTCIYKTMVVHIVAWRVFVGWSVLERFMPTKQGWCSRCVCVCL